MSFLSVFMTKRKRKKKNDENPLLFMIKKIQKKKKTVKIIFKARQWAHSGYTKIPLNYNTR
jgi:hypothetical protein